MKPKNRMTISHYIFIAIVATLIISGCSTRKYVCNSIPEHALITAKSDTTQNNAFFTYFSGEAPATIKLQFWGADAKYYLIAEKRGYLPVTNVVTKDSLYTKTFALQRINGVSESIYPAENFRNATYYFLPPALYFQYHKGSGAFSRYEYDIEVSKEIRSNFVKDLNARNNTSYSYLNCVANDSCSAYKDSIPSEILEYLFEVDAARLNYYSYPPSILPFIDRYGDVRTALPEKANAGQRAFFVCIWAECTSETAGRVVGELLLSSASTGYSATSDSGTQLYLYVIDASTLEVVHVYQKFYDQNLAKPEELKKVNDAVIEHLSAL